jgi:hypothetical protein
MRTSRTATWLGVVVAGVIWLIVKSLLGMELDVRGYVTGVYWTGGALFAHWFFNLQ